MFPALPLSRIVTFILATGITTECKFLETCAENGGDMLLQSNRRLSTTTIDHSVSDIPKTSQADATRLIPDVLLFNYKYHLLLQNGSNDLPLHSRNVRKIINAHPGMQVKFFDDRECRETISRMHSEELAVHFDHESFGPYKSDMCRLAMLYESGGYYFDNDIETVADFRTLIPPSATLSTVIEGGNDKIIFQGFFASTPKHPVLKLALDVTSVGYSLHHPSLVQVNVSRAGMKMHHRGWLGPENMGRAMRKWMGVDSFVTGSSSVQSAMDEHEEVYLFSEREDISDFSLLRRVGHGCCCNFFIADSQHVAAWSRFVGAGDFCSS